MSAQMKKSHADTDKLEWCPYTYRLVPLFRGTIYKDLEIRRSIARMTLSISLAAWRAAITIFHSFAIFSTILRYTLQCKSRRLGWDDHWALASLFLDILYFGSIWVSHNWYNGGPVEISKTQVRRRVILFWFACFLPLCVAWTARISMGLSISRYIPLQNSRARWALFSLWILFGLMFLSITLEEILVCGGHTSTSHGTVYVQCYPGQKLAIVIICTNLLGDACLVFVPLRILWKVKLPQNERWLIRILFAASILSTVAGIIYAVFLIKARAIGPNRGLFLTLSGHIKAATTLTVCNLLIVVTFIYRVFWKKGNETSSTCDTFSKYETAATTRPTFPSMPSNLTWTDIMSDPSTLSSHPDINSTELHDTSATSSSGLSRPSGTDSAISYPSVAQP